MRQAPLGAKSGGRKEPSCARLSRLADGAAALSCELSQADQERVCSPRGPQSQHLGSVGEGAPEAGNAATGDVRPLLLAGRAARDAGLRSWMRNQGQPGSILFFWQPTRRADQCS